MKAVVPRTTLSPADQRQVIADHRHAEIMAQFEKLLARPSEN
jgi:hypothetical protein